jgi:hypothetical protein
MPSNSDHDPGPIGDFDCCHAAAVAQLARHDGGQGDGHQAARHPDQTQTPGHPDRGSTPTEREQK